MYTHVSEGWRAGPHFTNVLGMIIFCTELYENSTIFVRAHSLDAHAFDAQDEFLSNDIFKNLSEIMSKSSFLNV